MGQNRIRGGWGVKNGEKSSDIIYVRSQRIFLSSFFHNQEDDKVHIKRILEVPRKL